MLEAIYAKVGGRFKTETIQNWNFLKCFGKILLFVVLGRFETKKLRKKEILVKNSVTLTSRLDVNFHSDLSIFSFLYRSNLDLHFCS